MQADSEKLRQAWIKAVQNSIATAFRDRAEDAEVALRIYLCHSCQERCDDNQRRDVFGRKWTESHLHLQAVWSRAVIRERRLLKGTARCRRLWLSLVITPAVIVGSPTRAGPASTWASLYASSAPGYTGVFSSKALTHTLICTVCKIVLICICFALQESWSSLL